MRPSSRRGKKQVRDGVLISMDSRDWETGSEPNESTSSSMLQTDAATFARFIREQEALPLSNTERDELSRALEASKNDAELLANTMSALQSLLDRLEPGPDHMRERRRDRSSN
jgi:hypothetical protein